MTDDCVPFPRQRLYWLLTAPMFLVYLAVGWVLFTTGWLYLVIYLALFPIVMVGQSTACLEFQCPYIDGFGPCVGGFCLPARWLARLYRDQVLPRWLFQVGLTSAEIAFFGIILFPVYFLYQAGALYLSGYSLIIILYAGIFLTRICPVCAIREKCPGGKASSGLLQLLPNHEN